MDAPPIQCARTEDGVNIAHSRFGQGPLLMEMPNLGLAGPTLAAIPSYSAYYEQLAQHRTIVSYDARGFGGVGCRHRDAASPHRSLRPNETPIRIRVGINAGEPIEENDDLYGTAVIQAARVMGRANGGQILVTDTVRPLVAGKAYPFSDPRHARLERLRGASTAVRGSVAGLIGAPTSKAEREDAAQGRGRAMLTEWYSPQSRLAETD